MQKAFNTFSKRPVYFKVITSILGIVFTWAALTLGLRLAFGNTSLGADFLIYWESGRAAVLEGKNPYSQEVVSRIQHAVYGQDARPDQDQLVFVYPPYALVPAIPFLFLPFDWAHAGWMAFQILVLLFCIILAMRKSAPWIPITFFFFYPPFFGVLLGNFVVLVAAIHLAFFGLVFRSQKPCPGIQFLLGIALAWSTCKPQYAWLVLAFALLLSLRLRLYRVLSGFVTGIIGFLLISFLIYPPWIQDWTNRVLIYPSYTQNTPTLTMILNSILPENISAFLTGAAVFACLLLILRMGWNWWQARLEPIYLLAFLGIVTFLFEFHSIAYDQLNLYVPLFIWATFQSGKHRSTVLWWFFLFIISWLAFAAGLNLRVLDRLPVLAFAVWWAWIYTHRKRAPVSMPI